jgi:hypothetical protein
MSEHPAFQRTLDFVTFKPIVVEFSAIQVCGADNCRGNGFWDRS